MSKEYVIFAVGGNHDGGRIGFVLFDALSCNRSISDIVIMICHNDIDSRTNGRMRGKWVIWKHRDFRAQRNMWQARS